MKTQEFINKLNENKEKSLLIEFSKGEYAGTNYHLTEVKNVAFSTVDCGGNTNNWKETHLQIWESPREIDKKDYLTVNKVLSILNRVNGINPLWLETEIKVEFGNDVFHTSVMKIDDFEINNNQLIVKLFSEKTLCKAPDVCGDEAEEKSTSCCEPSSGCC